jgi:hypothetical protein
LLAIGDGEDVGLCSISDSGRGRVTWKITWQCAEGIGVPYGGVKRVDRPKIGISGVTIFSKVEGMEYYTLRCMRGAKASEKKKTFCRSKRVLLAIRLIIVGQLFCRSKRLKIDR